MSQTSHFREVFVNDIVTRGHQARTVALTMSLQQQKENKREKLKK
jgi:hypothetical protein